MHATCSSIKPRAIPWVFCVPLWVVFCSSLSDTCHTTVTATGSSDTHSTKTSFLGHLLYLMREKSQYGYRPFPFVDRREFKQFWDRNSFNKKSATPFAVKNLSFLKPHVNSVEKFIHKYEGYDAAYQLKSDGSPTGDGNVDDDNGCLSIKQLMDKFSLNGPSKIDWPGNNDRFPLHIPTSIPYLKTTPADIRGANSENSRKLGVLLYRELQKYKLHNASPIYLESQTYDDMDCQNHLARELRRNNDTYEQEYTLLKNNIDSSSNDPTTLFVYIGKQYSGSYIHKHGTACAFLLGGRRVWMLYNSSGMERLNNLNLPKHIPHKCPRLDATCIEGLHPIDMIQHYEELVDLRLEPYLHVQENGDVFCFPEGWYHGTLNVDNNLTLAVSLVLDEQEVPVETNIEWEEEDLDEEVPSVKPAEEEL